MKTTAILLIFFLLALVWFTTNALTAATFLSGKKNDLKEHFSGQDPSMEELHKRVEELQKK